MKTVRFIIDDGTTITNVKVDYRWRHVSEGDIERDLAWLVKSHGGDITLSSWIFVE